jgi:hypothetical protein
MLMAPRPTSHLDDLREALGADPEPAGEITRMGFAIYRTCLRARLAETGLPTLALSYGARVWVFGDDDPAATLTADRHELFRIICGRRSEASSRSQRWDGRRPDAVPVGGLRLAGQVPELPQPMMFDQGQIVEEGPPAKIFGEPDHDRTRTFLKAVLEER